MFKMLLTPRHLDEIKNVYIPIYNSLNETQKEIIWDPAKFKIVQGVRRSGKTRIIVALALLHAVCASPKRILITTPIAQMTDIIKRDLERLYTTVKSDVTYSFSSNMIKFSNNSSIEVRSIQSLDYVASYINHYDLLLMDEAALYDRMDGTNIHKTWEYLRICPEIVVLSTRINRSKKNFFWNTWLNAVLGNTRFKPFKMNNKDIKVSKEDISTLKRTLSRSEYDTQFTIRWK